MIVYVVIALMACAICPISAGEDQTFDGTCPNISVQEKFNESEYAGYWYEIKRFENSFIDGQCSYPNYKLEKEGHYKVNFNTTNLTDKKNTTKAFELKKKGSLGDYDVYINATFKDLFGYKVVDTDYKTYSVVFGCINTDSNTKHKERVSIYARTKTLSEENLNKALKVFTTHKLNSTYLTNVEQDDKKCGRNSATSLVLPTILTTVMAMLLTKKF